MDAFGELGSPAWGPPAWEWTPQQATWKTPAPRLLGQITMLAYPTEVGRWILVSQHLRGTVTSSLSTLHKCWLIISFIYLQIIREPVTILEKTENAYPPGTYIPGQCLNEGPRKPTRDTWHCLKTFLVITAWGGKRDALGTEVRGASTVHKTDPHNNELAIAKCQQSHYLETLF